MEATGIIEASHDSEEFTVSHTEYKLTAQKLRSLQRAMKQARCFAFVCA